ncbi:MAG: hypothetical protein KIG88_09430 [Weeksellaceae bacterium]|nr:hypothetical protein [Weeksellaceae bacterium]
MEKRIVNRIIEYIFFSNFFMGLLSIGLNLETNIKLGLQLNDLDYYLFISSLSVIFYLFAYKIPIKKIKSSNQRTQFYIDHRKSIHTFNIILYIICCLYAISIFIKTYQNLFTLHWIHYLILIATFLLAISYYNWKFGFSLRKYTWFKPTLIAWTWAITTVYLPLLILQLTEGISNNWDARFYFLFSQTFMYFIVNAIMFDMKDYEDDTNRGLKTFVVKYGNQLMLNRVILPLIFLGFLSFILFGFWYDLPLHRILFMLVPIILMAIFAFKLNRPKSILYYLIAIDGMIFLKAIFGILSVIQFEYEL